MGLNLAALKAAAAAAQRNEPTPRSPDKDITNRQAPKPKPKMADIDALVVKYAKIFAEMSDEDVDRTLSRLGNAFRSVSVQAVGLVDVDTEEYGRRLREYTAATIADIRRKR